MADLPPVSVCPACSGTMSHHVIDQIPLDLCSRCGGVWFDAGELQKEIKQGQADLDQTEKLEPPQLQPVSTDNRWLCPRDQTVLHHSIYKGHAGANVATCYQCAGLFVTGEGLKILDQLSDQPGGIPSDPVLTPEEKEQVATLQAQSIGDLYRSELRNYAWQSWMYTPMWAPLFPL